MIIVLILSLPIAIVISLIVSWFYKRKHSRDELKQSCFNCGWYQEGTVKCLNDEVSAHGDGNDMCWKFNIEEDD